MGDTYNHTAGGTSAGHTAATAGILHPHAMALLLAAIMHPRLTATLSILAVYVAVCHLLRFRRLRGLHRQHDHAYPDRDSFAKMTANDAQAILATIQQREFPFMYTLAIEFGIFKTYGIPTISKVVGATRAVTDELPAAKRAADTLVIMSESVHPRVVQYKYVMTHPANDFADSRSTPPRPTAPCRPLRA